MNKNLGFLPISFLIIYQGEQGAKSELDHFLFITQQHYSGFGKNRHDKRISAVFAESKFFFCHRRKIDFPFASGFLFPYDCPEFWQNYGTDYKKIDLILSIRLAFDKRAG